MTVAEIVKEYLDSHGHDGLFWEGPGCSDNCGCSKDDLFPCMSCSRSCQPAYEHKDRSFYLEK